MKHSTGTSAKTIAEFERLLELIRLEKEEELERFKRMVQSLPLEKRRSEGYTWFPVDTVKKGYTIGDRAYVTVKRTKNLGEEHQFRSGKTVNLFTQLPSARRREYSGVVYFVDKDRMKIILNSRDLPNWLEMGEVGVDLLFDETTYQKMEAALQAVIKASGDRLAELRRIFGGEQEPRFREIAHPINISSLNPSQNQAIDQILAAQDVAVVHGPPGTGKTTTLVQAVRLLCETEATVLVTAPSNTAVDLLTERLAAQELRVVRIGNISRVDESIVRHTLEARLAAHPESKTVKKIKVQAAEARRNAQRYRRRYGREEARERRELFREARELSAWANQLEDRIIDEILDSAQVITCTLVGAAHKELANRKFRTVVVDEAAQALEPANWIPITKASRVVLVGDPFQLSPTVKSMAAQRGGLNVTLIEKCLERLPRVSLLNVQYRMNETIMGFSNRQFYDNALRADASVAHHRLLFGANDPLVFIDTAGCGFDEKVHERYLSRFNPDEFRIVCEHLYQLADAYEGKDPPSIALISPYREQVMHMEEVIAEDGRLASLALTINTIDGFQGQERDVVYLSLVRSNTKGEIGFLKDYRRINVAMTRARRQLVIVGDSATIGQDRFYTEFLKYCEGEGRYLTAWSYMV